MVSININFGKNKWQDVLESDAWGYYAYLPAVFIYHDLHFSFYDKVMHDGYFEERLAYEYRVDDNGKVTNKYFCGTAVAVAPFFLCAHLLNGIIGYPQDGYNRFYILSVNIAAIFYTSLGLFFLSKLLQFYTNKVLVVIVVITAMAFGTQLFYYSFGEPGMSHVYSFCFVNLFLWQVKKWFEKKGKYDLLIAALALGMVFLIRPINILIVLIIPFLAGSINMLKGGIAAYIDNKRIMIGTLLLFILVGSLQSLFYFLQTGKIWVDSYPGENFNFLNPHVFDILFSFRKGLFIYTPIVLIGHLALFKRSKFFVLSYIFFFIILTYVLSCWWIWYYGGSFSLRAYIEYFGIFAILLSLFLNDPENRNIKLVIIFLLLVLCQIQTYQYRYFIIHWSEMNFEKYIASIKRILVF